MQPVARTRVDDASFVLQFTTSKCVYLYAFICQKIISSAVLTFYSRLCSYLNIEVNPAPGVHLPCGSSFPFVHGVHCGLPSVFHTRRAPVLLLGHVRPDPRFSSVKLCCA